MPTDIKNAIGIQRQFRPMPGKVYQKNLLNPNYSAVKVGKDYSAERFAESLGVASKATWNEAVSKEQREQNQYTLEMAQRAVAALSPEELRHFDQINFLQHYSGTKYDLSDNKYAIALLNKAMGQRMANEAMEQYLQDNEGKVPKSSDDAVTGYQNILQKYYDDMDRTRIVNPDAFEAGLYESNFENSFKIADTARKAIKADYQAQGVRTIATRFDKLMSNSTTMGKFGISQAMGQLAREAQFYVDTPAQAAELWSNLFESHKDLMANNDVLDAVSNLSFFTADGKEHKFGEELPQGNYRKAVQLNATKELAKSLADKFRDPKTGLIDVGKAKAEAYETLKKRRQDASGEEYLPMHCTVAPEIDTYLQEACREFGVPLTVASVVRDIESSTMENIIRGGTNDAGCVGPMQLKPSTFAGLEVGDNVYDMRQNCFAGVKYLKQLYDQFGDWKLAALHYNCGPNGNINNAETRGYAQKWDERFAKLQKNPQYGKQLNPSVSLQSVVWEVNPESGRDAWVEFQKCRPELQAATPQILGKLVAMGIDNGVIHVDSTYRDGDRGDHGKGDALDIYIGDFDKGTGQAYAEKFLPYFNQAFYEIPGDNPPYGYSSGYHIHLGGYKGGLEKTNNTLDTYGQAYADAEYDTTCKEIERLANDAHQEYTYHQSQAQEQVKQIMYGSGSWSEKKAALDKVQYLSDGDKAQLNYKIDKTVEAENKAARAEAARAARNASKHPTGNVLADKWLASGKYAQDWNTVTRLNEKKAENGGTLDEDEQKQLDKAYITVKTVESATMPGLYADLGWYNGTYYGVEGAKEKMELGKRLYRTAIQQGESDTDVRAWLKDNGLPSTDYALNTDSELADDDDL